MQVPRQRAEPDDPVPLKGASARTRALMVTTAAGMMRRGLSPSVSEVADADRLASLYRTAFPRLIEHEATFRAALRQSLDPGASDVTLGRGHRRDLLARATKGLGLPAEQARKLACALSLTFGVEAMVVLKDIWGMRDSEVGEMAIWAAEAMLAAARREAGMDAV